MTTIINEQAQLQAKAEFILTYKCNLACTYCHVKDMPPISMSAGTAKKSLHTFFDITKNIKYLSISFTGGEPLLEIDTLQEMVEQTKKYSRLHNKIISISIFTNATLVSEEVLKFVKSNDIELLISIDGNQQSHDSNRRYKKGGGSFTDVVSKTKRIANCNIKHRINLSVSEENASNLYAGVKKLVQRGIYNFKIGPIYGSKDWESHNSSDFCENLTRVCRDAQIWGNNEKVISILPINKKNLHVDNKSKGVWGCSAGLSNLAFTPDGLIIGCSSMAPLTKRFPEFILGDIQHLFKDKDLKYFFDLKQENPNRRKKCIKCNSKDNCAGGCLAINATVTGDPLIPPEHYCEAIKTIPDAWSMLWKKVKLL